MSNDNWPVRKYKRIRIITSDDSDDEDIHSNKNTELSENDCQSYSRSSQETTDQERLSDKMDVCRTLQITLTRLEELSDMDVIRWRTNSVRNTSRSPTLSYELEETDSNYKETPKNDERASTSHEETLTSARDIEFGTTLQRRANAVDNNEVRDQNVDIELILLDDDNSSIDVDTSKVSSKSPKAFDSHNKTIDVTKLDAALKSCLNLWKNKLFRNPKILLIRLETLHSSTEDGVYSASEIESLTRKYIKSVIKTCSTSHKSMYKLVNSERPNKTTNITNTTEDNANTTVSKALNSEDTLSTNRQISDKRSSRGMIFLLIYS